MRACEYKITQTYVALKHIIIIQMPQMEWVRKMDGEIEREWCVCVRVCECGRHTCEHALSTDDSRTGRRRQRNNNSKKTHFPKLSRFCFSFFIILFCGPKRNMRALNKLAPLWCGMAWMVLTENDDGRRTTTMALTNVTHKRRNDDQTFG